MRKRDLQELGLERGQEARLAMQAYHEGLHMGMTPAASQAAIEMVVDDPARYENDSLYGDLASALLSRQDGETRARRGGPSGRREDER